MSSFRTRFYPLADQDEHEVISLFSTMQTGEAGILVKIVTGTANPQNSEGYTSAAVGFNPTAAGAFVMSNRFENKFKVTPTISGDTVNVALGLTKLGTLEFDENRMPLIYDDRRAREIGVVRSGETVPIITKATVLGLWGKYIDTSMGNVQPGNLVVISRSGNGLLAAVDPTDATKFNATGASTFVYTQAQVLGKWLTSLPTSSNTGIASEFSTQGGFALFTFNCNK